MVTDADRKEFSEELRELLQKTVLTEIDLAHEFGVSRRAIHRWKSGAGTPSPLAQNSILSFLRKMIVQ